MLVSGVTLCRSNAVLKFFVICTLRLGEIMLIKFEAQDWHLHSSLHPGRLTWTIIMEVWKIIFLSKWVICRFHVNLPGCNSPESIISTAYTSGSLTCHLHPSQICSAISAWMSHEVRING